MSILKIKENNVWKDVIALKGDKGDPGETGVFIGKKENALETHKLVIEETENHKSLSGTEINITDGIDSSVKRLRQYGYTKQDGTPTLDAPIEIEVGRGKNLISSTQKVGSALYLNGTTTPSNYVFKPGTYTISYVNANATAVYIKTATTDNTRLGANNPLTFTVNEDFNVWLYRDGMVEGEVSNIQLEKGSVATSYLPYNTIESKSTGSNMFNAKLISNTAIEVNEDSSVITMPISTSGNGNISTGSKLSELAHGLKAGDEVYLNFDTTSKSNSFIYLYGKNISWYKSNSIVITQDMLDSIVFLYGNNANGGETEQVIISDLRMVLGTQDKPFEPYKESSLQHHLGDNFIADKDYIENGVLHKHIGKIVLNGSETWEEYTNYLGEGKCYQIENGTFALSNITSVNYIHSYCSHFKNVYSCWGYDTSKIGTYSDHGTVHRKYFISNKATLEEFKAWLSENPVTVYYELATPTQKQLETTGELRTFEPNTIITNDLDTNMEVDYNTAPNVNMYYRNSNGSLNKVYM